MVKSLACNTRTNKRLQFCCLLLFIAAACSCGRNNGNAPSPLQQQLQQLTRTRVVHAAAAVHNAALLLQPGDIITRTGTDFTSESLRRLCRRDNTYSHCGIVNIENDSIVVYHALGGETSANQQLKREPLAVFCNGNSNKGFGIFRMPLTPAVYHRVDSMVHACYAAGLPFDMAFDLHTDDKMYCSEFVYKTFSRAFGNPHLFTTTTTGSLQYAGVDDIFLQPSCTAVARYKYD
ncbi:YiiX/YebB-like N1pC/P60 family cysteine hydrolase [Deminuibacter soli]|uniref:Permuted papain-like amidase enzyme, YaeF/YiiX, C92 family n=1 Tax=Deminuibacter soli TaxID=2291815 RepID=A0A3E1NIF9_9BACT|nr:YiiX/YebB-like N1pC/P60 family cysteine hydrolase [Deminuibacter soli]RFM27712.1 hypothetical protein DXN05_13475 [Deminuibacter soli]